MAYNKGEELKKKIAGMHRLLFAAKVFRVLFFGYFSAAFLFWFLNSFDIDRLYLFNRLFILPYKAVRLIYKPPELGADLTLAIIGVISLFLGLAVHAFIGGLYEKIAILKERLEKAGEQKKPAKRKAAKPIPGGSREFPNMKGFIPDMVQEDSIILVFIIHPYINKIKTSADEAELSLEEFELWRKRINKHILENVKHYQKLKPAQKGYYRKNLFLTYKDFSSADIFTADIKPEIKAAADEFRKYNIDVQFSLVLSAITQLSALEDELDLMDTILSLNFVNSFILTSSFKKAYEILDTRMNTPVLKGEYNLSKNLSITNTQPLYEFKSDNDNEVQL